MKILVTGASGLLGTDIVKTFEKKGHEVIKTAFSQRDGFIAADISKENGIKTLSDLNWDLIIHTSASRDPDICENNKTEAYRLNVWASEKLAEAAFKKNARMLFISTDYVFSGEKAPYKEIDETNPINYYGKNKVEAEELISKILVENVCIIRVPVLYGINAGLKASALLNSSITLINSGKTSYLDDYIIRYPTFTEDVSRAIFLLVEKNAFGIYHYSGQDKTTKYKIALMIADLLGKNHNHLNKISERPNTAARRPYDSHLDISKITYLGFRKPLPLKERLKSIVHNL
ncbi:MAG TPA: SDR family oxidoreductase [Victivallales bacterium]|nr:SDR family oxidoreductase [Victivallales bacterium]